MQYGNISDATIKRREYWINEIVTLSGHFGQDSTRVEKELDDEILKDGLPSLLDHLRLCGSIPESYGHDSSEEKLYSKYTDCLLSEFFKEIGLNSLVLTERADAADVEAACGTYSLVADAKAFRLSRTAKNQKDFKIEAMNNWKRGKKYAIVVCPIYQLPSRTSQIYQQAISRDVCILSYSHLATILQFADKVGKESAIELLLTILESTNGMNPTKDAVDYWTALNRNLLNNHAAISKIWSEEKKITLDAIKYSKEEALTVLSKQRESILMMTKEQAIKALLGKLNIEGKEKVIRSVADNGLLAIA